MRGLLRACILDRANLYVSKIPLVVNAVPFVAAYAPPTIFCALVKQASHDFFFR